MNIQLPAEIFKAYDIRGIVGKTLTPKSATPLGKPWARWRANATSRPSPSAATGASPAPNWPVR